MKENSIDYWVRFDFRFDGDRTESRNYGPIGDEAAAHRTYRELLGDSNTSNVRLLRRECKVIERP